MKFKMNALKQYYVITQCNDVYEYDHAIVSVPLRHAGYRFKFPHLENGRLTNSGISPFRLCMIILNKMQL